MEPTRTMNEIIKGLSDDQKKQIIQGYKRFQELMEEPKFREIVYNAVDQLILGVTETEA